MHRRGFSLASLLLLTAVVAVFLAAICTVWLPSSPAQEEDAVPVLEPWPVQEGLIVLSVIGGLLVGSFVGLVIGAGQLRPLPGVCLGTFVGMLAGTATGVLLAVPDKTLPIAIGSLVIVLFGAMVRRFSARP